MDWALFWTASGVCLTGTGFIGAAVIYIVKSETKGLSERISTIGETAHMHTESRTKEAISHANLKVQQAVSLRRQEAKVEHEETIERLTREFDITLRAALSEHADDLLKRVNGAYMRGPEQRAINESFAQQISKMGTTLERFIDEFHHRRTGQ